MGSLASTRIRLEPGARSNLAGFDSIDALAAFSLLVVLALRGAWEWRYFDRFLTDHGWYFRVAERVAAGEMLYRDVGWDYGPLPVYILALLFQVSKTIVWAKLLDLVLAGASVWSVFVIARRLAGRRTAVWLAAWAALLGASKGLLSFHLEAYTSAVAWGAATSLLTLAAASGWVAGRSAASLAAAAALAVASVLCKPEYGLAGASVLALAVLQRRPAKALAITTVAIAAAAIVVIGLRASPATLHAWWRGYSGYDLIAVGQVPLSNVPRMLGALLAAAILALSLWSGVVRLGAMAIVAAFVVHRMWGGTSVTFLLQLASAVAAAVWVGVVPALLWLAWKGRKAGIALETWVLCTYGVVVNLRPFLYGDFCSVAAGPVAALAIFAVRRGIIRRPPRWGLLVFGIFALLIPLHDELHSLRRTQHSEPVDTRLGVARVSPSVAAEIREVRAVLDSMPAGPLFVSGWGPCWYFVSGRRNPTRFDALLDGIGTTEPEVSRLYEDLRADPPVVVMTERRFVANANYSHEKMWAEIGRPFALQHTTRSHRWEVFFREDGHARTGSEVR